jgi:hypothetical protein
MYRRQGKWFTFADLERIAEVFAPPRHQYVKYLGKRIDACMREMERTRIIREKER